MAQRKFRCVRGRLIPLVEENRRPNLEEVTNAKGDASPGRQNVLENWREQIYGQSDARGAEPEEFVIRGPGLQARLRDRLNCKVFDGSFHI